jgi:hypothetical protein
MEIMMLQRGYPGLSIVRGFWLLRRDVSVSL